MEPIVIKSIDGQIKLAYSGQALGNTSQQFGAGTEVNFAKFTAKFPGKIVYSMPAVGKDNIVNIDGLKPEELDKLEADALITKNPSALLVLKAADCIPLVFYVPGQKILALAHVGTPGAVLHLPRKVIEFQKIDPASLQVYFGPAITKNSYKFPEQDFDKQLDDSWEPYITHKDGFVHLDLIEYVMDELKAAGIKPENITVETVDTGADPAYFSHRRHKLVGEPDGRNAFGVCLA